MEYSLDFRGNTIELPKYTLAITDKFDKLEKDNSKVLSAKERVKNIYKFLEDLLGKERTKEILDDFNNCDPNEVNILYLDIIKCYNKPVEEHESSGLKEQMDNAGVAEIIKLLEAISKSNISFKPNSGVPYRVVK